MVPFIHSATTPIQQRSNQLSSGSISEKPLAPTSRVCASIRVPYASECAALLRTCVAPSVSRGLRPVLRRHRVGTRYGASVAQALFIRVRTFCWGLVLSRRECRVLLHGFSRVYADADSARYRQHICSIFFWVFSGFRFDMRTWTFFHKF